MIRAAGPETAAIGATSPTVASVTVPAVETSVAPRCVHPPNCTTGTSRAAAAPIRDFFEEALALGCNEDAEMVPVAEFSDDIDEEIQVSAAVGVRPLLTASGTNAAPSLHNLERANEDEEGSGGHHIRSHTVPEAKGAGVFPVPVDAVGGIPVPINFAHEKEINEIIPSDRLVVFI